MDVQLSRLRSWKFGLTVGLMALLAGGSAIPEGQVPSRFEGKFVPDPPRQRDPWTAPSTRLPRFLVNATGPLFDEGVADPRGCDYRDVTMAGRMEQPARGFVLPERADVPGRFFVGWDGLIHLVVRVGDPADLDRDVRMLIESLKQAHQQEAGLPDRNYGNPGWGFPVKQGELYGLSGLDDSSPIKLCLLLRLGRADLAEALFAAGTSWTADGKAPALTTYQISALSLATDWLKAAGSDLHGARAQGDLVIAVDLARRMTRFRDLAEPRLAAMGFTPPGPSGWSHRVGDRGSLFPFLDQLDVLRADTENRLAQPIRTPIPARGGDPAARVAALIRDLDLIDESQMMSPGSANPGDSPLVAELVAEGDAAIGPLLTVLESDNRLTRSISYTRNMTGENYVHPVYEPAIVALSRLLSTGDFTKEHPYAFQPTRPEARQALARAMRDHWEKNRQIPLVEQWYRILLDDKAGADRWDSAAGTLAYPAYVEGEPVARPGTKPPLGESLRVGKDPSVTALLVRRIGEVRAMGDGNGSAGSMITKACGLATSLARWDKAPALPLLVELTHDCRTRLDGWRAETQNQNGPPQGLVQALVGLVTTRVELGDVKALDDYADWLRTSSPAMVQYNTLAAFQPLLDHPDHPSLASAAGWLFNDPQSSWVPLASRGANRDNEPFLNLFASPLATLTGFRAGLLAGLADRSPFGTVVKKEAHGSLEYQFRDQAQTINQSSSGDQSEDLATGVVVSFRTCDYLAARISDIQGAPLCIVHWPEARRESAVAQCIDFLKRYGDRLVPKGQPEEHDFPEALAHLALPNLGRPATPDDVAQGRALFTLEGQGEVRVVPLPGFPQPSRWITLKDTPIDQTDQAGVVTRTYLTDGWVWQAEEVRRGDLWERYYGYVGHHVVAKVPAAEIEFGSLYFRGWGELTGGLATRLELAEPEPKIKRQGLPILTILAIRNQRGLARSSPTELVRVGPDGKSSLRRGVTLELSYSDPTKPAPRRFQSGATTAIAARRSSHFEPGEASRRLDPLELFEAGRFDLNDWFDLSKAGSYHLIIKFAADSGLGEGVGGCYFEVGGGE